MVGLERCSPRSRAFFTDIGAQSCDQAGFLSGRRMFALSNHRTSFAFSLPARLVKVERPAWATHGLPLPFGFGENQEKVRRRLLQPTQHACTRDSSDFQAVPLSWTVWMKETVDAVPSASATSHTPPLGGVWTRYRRRIALRRFVSHTQDCAKRASDALCRAPCSSYPVPRRTRIDPSISCVTKIGLFDPERLPSTNALSSPLPVW